MLDFDSMSRLWQKVYAAASEASFRHPFPFSQVTGHSLESIQGLLKRTREQNELDRDGGDFLRIAMEELFEYCEASLIGDHRKAERELLDVFAVLLKEYERIERAGNTSPWGRLFMRGDR